MKAFFRSLAGLVVIIILAAIILIFLGWSRVPDIIAGHLSKTLKVVVEIGDIELSLKSIEVEKLEISNPHGYFLPRAFAADRISIQAPLTRYFHNDIEIDEITIDNVYLGLEFDSPQGAEGNWTSIMKGAQETSSSDSQKGKKTVMIRSLVLTNIHTDLIYRSQGNKVRRLPVIKRIELKNISSEGGDSAMDQIMNSSLGEMLKQVFIEQNLNDMLDKIFQPNSKNPLLNQPLKQFRGLFGALDKEVINQ